MSDSSKLTLVPKAKVSDKIKQNTIDILERALADAKAGRIDGLMLCVKRPSGRWSDERTGVEDFSSAIGMLEIIKQEWIADYIVQCKKDQ